ncbi:hypothetical protein ACLBKU_14195 [Erythrobacter sp. NE805]|uniref:hypothetical protein n=1 Tax=Erythrobacter sp. NE805 TaxID=3389875 RepID=UPI00396B0504
MSEVVVVAVAVVAIVLIAGMTVNGIVEKVMQAKRLRYEAKAGTDAPALHEIAERQQMIEDRLRVLERIATDRGTVLSDEIEALRLEKEIG